MRKLCKIMEDQVNLAYPIECLDDDFDNMAAIEGSLFYETPMNDEEMEAA